MKASFHARQAGVLRGTLEVLVEILEDAQDALPAEVRAAMIVARRRLSESAMDRKASYPLRTEADQIGGVCRSFEECSKHDRCVDDQCALHANSLLHPVRK